jgi:hypothetical protein
MGLLAPDQPGQSKFFSGAIVQAVRARKQDLEAQKAQKESDKAARLLEKQAEKDHRATEAEEQRQTRATERAENRLRNRLNWRLVELKSSKKQNRAVNRSNKPTKQARTKTMKRKLSNAKRVELPEPKTRVVRSGRAVALPSRFRQ